MPDKEERLRKLLSLLPSLATRPGMKPGDGSFGESRWAAIRIRNEFGENAVLPLAATLSLWGNFDPSNYTMIRQFGFRDSEVARECKYTAISEAAWCLRQIPMGVKILLKELRSEESTRRRNVATALGAIGSTIAVEQLIDALTDTDKGVVEAACLALKRITGKSFLFSRGKDAGKWRKWWNKRQGHVAK